MLPLVSFVALGVPAGAWELGILANAPEAPDLVVAKLYPEKDFGGTALEILAADLCKDGNGADYSGDIPPSHDNQVSSVWVDERFNCWVVLYDGDGQTGPSCTVKEDVADLGSLGCDNMASSYALH